MTVKKMSRLVPKLRFPEFRNDPPWLAPQISDLYSFKRSNTLPRDKLDYTIGNIKNIHYGDIHTKFEPLFRLRNEHVPYIGPDVSADGFNEDAFCEEGDIVLADASEDLEDVGKAIEVVSLDGEHVVAGTHTILATRRGSAPVIGFGGQLFQSTAVRTGIKKEAHGAKVYGISANRISAVLIPIPPTEAEQQKIADCLGSLDDLIAAQSWKLEVLRQHKQGLMQQLFPQPGENVPQLRFPEFEDASDWEEESLGNLVTIISGKSPSLYELLAQGECAFVKVEDLNNCTKYQINAREYCNDVRGVVPIGSLLFPKRGAAIENNKIRITASEVLIDTNLMALAPHNAAATEFLYYYLVRVGLAQIADTSSIPQINNKHIIPYRVLVPSDSEQRRISDCLSAFDDQIVAQARKLEALKQHKQGLLQQLFPSQ
ncbi:restriction endonuclease subunit S [Algihabitans sp.]|uniref:restriction endonuclease subunit S n=1 Tax=Algihabitans sp. TaxID=2821514 RepID=UPI003BAD92D5